MVVAESRRLDGVYIILLREMSTQLEYQHGSDVSVLRGCPNPYAADLLAVGGEHSIEVLQIVSPHCL